MTSDSKRSPTTLIALSTSSAIANSGTLQANSGSVLGLSDAVNNSGTIFANGGTVYASAGFTGATGTARLEDTGRIGVLAASSVGNLIHNGSNSLALNMQTNNLTVHIDYNNANFGTGNAFNARANVAGTGQILAAGTPEQARLAHPRYEGC